MGKNSETYLFFGERLILSRFNFTPRGLLADEFWSYLSGEANTMQKVLDIINSIANPEFLDNLNFINDYNNIKKDVKKCKQILSDWYLNEELEIIDTVLELLDNPPKNKAIQKLIYQSVFKQTSSGVSYNQTRFEAIKECKFTK